MSTSSRTLSRNLGRLRRSDQQWSSMNSLPSKTRYSRVELLSYNEVLTLSSRSTKMSSSRNSSTSRRKSSESVRSSSRSWITTRGKWMNWSRKTTYWTRSWSPSSAWISGECGNLRKRTCSCRRKLSGWNTPSRNWPMNFECSSTSEKKTWSVTTAKCGSSNRNDVDAPLLCLRSTSLIDVGLFRISWWFDASQNFIVVSDKAGTSIWTKRVKIPC